ncbi:MAG: hypothetical protein WCJ61_10530 [Paludibacter sp.]
MELKKGEIKMDLSQITAGLVAVSASRNSIAGTGSKVYLISYSDINRITSTVVANVITAIVLNATKKGYIFETVDNSVDGSSDLVKGTYYSDFDHKVPLRVFAKTQAAKTFVESLKLARVVAIVENKETGVAGEIKYEAYGWDAGLELMTMKSTTAMADKVVYEMELGSGAKSKETSLPKSVFITSLTATETMLGGLIV